MTINEAVIKVREADEALTIAKANVKEVEDAHCKVVNEHDRAATAAAKAWSDLADAVLPDARKRR